MRHERLRDAVVVYLQGELDHHCAQGVRREMDALIEDRRVKTLIIDMEDMAFMDSSGIGVILGRYRTLRERGGRVQVRRMNRQVRRIFNLSGMGQIIEVIDG